MTADVSSGWNVSAHAWIVEQGDKGDYGRQYVLDAPVIERVRRRHYEVALDVGCGEGRFCRILRTHGIRTVGIDPTEALIARARAMDPGGDYRVGRAETLDGSLGAFDLVVSYLTLIDIPDLATALARMADALRPGGTLLIVNLTSFLTAGLPAGWTTEADGARRFSIDHYLEERPIQVSWRGISIRNWHRPLSTYMGLLLGHGLELRYFAEPAPTGGDPAKADRYRRVPYFHIMEWEKPAA